MNLKDFVTHNLDLAEAEFLERYPHCFLIMPGSEVSAAPEQSAFSTPATENITALVRAQLVEHSVLALTRRNPGDQGFMITVGRARRCDVVIPDGRVSKFHAFFHRDGGKDSWFVTDAGSSNGTSVNGVALAANQPREVAPKDEILFAASLPCTFHTAASMYQQLHAMAQLL
jgi:hypothetical protein